MFFKIKGNVHFITAFSVRRVSCCMNFLCQKISRHSGHPPRSLPPSAAAGRRPGRSPMVLLHQLGIYPQHLRKRCFKMYKFFVLTTTQKELHFGPGPFPPPEETGTPRRLKAKCWTLRRCLLRQPCWTHPPSPSAASASDPGPGRGIPAPPPRRRKNPGILFLFNWGK